MPPVCALPTRPNAEEQRLGASQTARVDAPVPSRNKYHSGLSSVSEDTPDDASQTSKCAHEKEFITLSPDFSILLNSIRSLEQRMETNLRFTKAIYRGTKKSLTGPGHESAHLHAHRDQGVQQRVMSGGHDILPPPIFYSNEGLIRQDSTYVEGHEHAFHRQFDRLQVPVVHSAEGLPRQESPDSNGSSQPKAMQQAVKGDPTADDDASLEVTPRPCQDEQRPKFGTHTHDRAGTMLELTKMMMLDESFEPRRATRVWRFLEDKNSSRGGLAYFHLRNMFLFLAVLASCIEAIELPAHLLTPLYRGQPLATPIQVVIESLFALELALRFLTCPHKLLFWKSIYNAIDLISSLIPLFVRLLIVLWIRPGSDASNSVLMVSFLGLIPVLRLLRSARHFETFQLLMEAFQAAVEALPVLLFTMTLLVLTFASLIYLFEPRDNIPTLPVSFYFVTVTLSTVGYGDFSPTTAVGRLCTVVLTIFGPMYMAIPLGIVGKHFGDIWDDRHRLFLLQRMRNCVVNAGYTARDLRRMFSLLDLNNDGTLDFGEFTSMLELMQVHVGEECITQVFESFDFDDEGSIDFQELLRGLFPGAHWLIREDTGSPRSGREQSPYSPPVSITTKLSDGTVNRNSSSSAAGQRRSPRSNGDRKTEL